MINTIKNIYKFLLVIKKYFIIKDWFWAKIIHERDISINEVIYNKHDNSIILKLFDYKLMKNDNLLILKTYNIAKQLNKLLGATFQPYNNNGVMFQINNNRGILKTLSDFYILDEIFNFEVYAFDLKDNVIVWNIGANIGLADIYFANKPNVKKIYAYEPFINNFIEAKINYSLNPHLNSKIQISQYGISNQNKSVTLKYSPEYKGNLGIIGLKEGLRVNVSNETINLLEATNVLKQIIENHPNEIIIAKIDCEGSEYDIIQNLAQNNMLNNIHCFMIEWHDRGIEPIINYIRQFGFISIYYGVTGNSCGMIYYVKLK